MAAVGCFPDRVVLEGVPRVHFYEGGPRCPEDIILPSVMRALLERREPQACHTASAMTLSELVIARWRSVRRSSYD